MAKSFRPPNSTLERPRAVSSRSGLERASTVLLVTVAMVMVVDAVSSRLRDRLV